MRIYTYKIEWLKFLFKARKTLFCNCYGFYENKYKFLRRLELMKLTL